LPSEVEASPSIATSSVTILSGGHTDRASTFQDQIGFRRTGDQGMTTTREGRVGDWPLSRSVWLRHLLSWARGYAGWRSQRFRTL